MFSNQRYITRGVQSEIPIELQFFMWGALTVCRQKEIIFRVRHVPD